MENESTGAKPLRGAKRKPRTRCQKCCRSYMAMLDDHAQRGERMCSWFLMPMTCRRGKARCGAPPDGYKKGEG